LSHSSVCFPSSILDIPSLAQLKRILSIELFPIGANNALGTGVTEYSFFLASVIGLLLLRRLDAVRPGPPPYRTWTGNPLIFGAVSSLLVARALISEPSMGLAIIGAGMAGLGVFWLKLRHDGALIV
jgi:hypothetical protein